MTIPQTEIIIRKDGNGAVAGLNRTSRLRAEGLDSYQPSGNAQGRQVRTMKGQRRGSLVPCDLRDESGRWPSRSYCRPNLGRRSFLAWPRLV